MIPFSILLLWTNSAWSVQRFNVNQYHLVQKIIKTSKVPVVLKIGAPQCKPCVLLEPAFKKAETQFAQKAKLIELEFNFNDLDQKPVDAIWKELHLNGVPTVIVYSSEQEIARKDGYRSHEAGIIRAEFDAWLQKTLNTICGTRSASESGIQTDCRFSDTHLTQ